MEGCATLVFEYFGVFAGIKYAFNATKLVANNGLKETNSDDNSQPLGKTPRENS
jgi:hypothetical protein